MKHEQPFRWWHFIGGVAAGLAIGGAAWFCVGQIAEMIQMGSV